MKLLKNLYNKFFNKKVNEVKPDTDPFGDKFREQAKKILEMKSSDVSEAVKTRVAFTLDPVEFSKSLSFDEYELDTVTLRNLSPGARKKILKIVREDQNARIETFIRITENLKGIPRHLKLELK
ncbi:MAG TPA: hypothetical protein PKC87_00055 [Candidatus Absconditabacterales bacterium]|nr:hypothetical protein [Candidatus Absconditabacterales bacterium]